MGQREPGFTDNQLDWDGQRLALAGIDSTPTGQKNRTACIIDLYPAIAGEREGQLRTIQPAILDHDPLPRGIDRRRLTYFRGHAFALQFVPSWLQTELAMLIRAKPGKFVHKEKRTP